MNSSTSIGAGVSVLLSNDFSADFLRDIKITQYNRLGAMMIILYEYVITFDREVELVWGSRWSLTKVLFLLNRYCPLIDIILELYACFSLQVTHNLSVLRTLKILLNLTFDYYLSRVLSCRHFTRWEGWEGLTMNMISQLIMQLRIFALYSLKKRILFGLGFCFILCSSLSMWILMTQLPTLQAIEIPGGTFCASPKSDRGFDVFFLPIICYELLLCAMALATVFREYKATGSFWHRSQRLIRVLIRDSLGFFLIVSATYTLCGVWWAYAPLSLIEAPILFASSMCTISANRIIFNLRAAALDESPIYNSSLFR